MDARAGFWRRFGAAFIDGLVLSVVSFIIRAIAGVGVGYVLSFVVAGAYFGYFHGTTGQTPGDAALSIRVVDAEGGTTLGYGRALVRWLVSYVSAIAVLIGFLWMIWDAEKQTWHDKAARTFVIPA